jgi:anaerobic selenocysteine-containing dehydrogenase
VQGYNAQAVVGEGQIVLAAEISSESLDTANLQPMVETALGELARGRRREARSGVGRRRLLEKRRPLALITPKTHLFLNSTFANQHRQHGAQPEPFVVIHPDDAAARGIEHGAQIRVWNDRGAFEARARVSDDTRSDVLVALMGWWNRDYPRRLSAQATTFQALTTLGTAPIFNDNRVQTAPTTA